MKVFLSWSGTQSRSVAEALFTWLPRVIQAVDPFLSTEIDKGTRWSSEIDTALEGTRFGIICLTRENLSAPWILYEAGALSKSLDARIWTLLVDLAPTDVPFPLARFQHTTAEKSDVLRLLHTINRQVDLEGERALGEQALDEMFDMFWPKLEERLRGAIPIPEANARRARSERELLEEVLEMLRQEGRQVPHTVTYRTIGYLARYVERAIREKKLLEPSEIDWRLSWDAHGISLRATRLSDGASFMVSAPVRLHWPEGSSWNYAVEVADELVRLLADAMEKSASS